MSEQAPGRDATEFIRALREDGTHAQDPVGFYYLEALARRANDQQGHVGQLLQDKLMAATQAFTERARIQREVSQPENAATVQSPNPLRGLVDRLNAHTASDGVEHVPERVMPRPELKSVQNYRSTWSKLSIDKQVAHAFAQAPKNAGPLNSHVVALRALTQMRENSPDYLHRFLSYVDTLARLDQSGAVPVAGKKPSAKVDPGKKKRVTK
jgi:hypothetical protein